MSTTGRLTPPDGIGEEHERPLEGWRRHASPFGLAVFGAVVALALTGILGHERDWSADANGVGLQVHAPETTRSGEFMEMRIRVTPAGPIGELVIGVEGSLWEDLTVNTMIPAATEEESANGEFRFVFAPLAPDTAFDLKVDLQVNPDIVGGNDGLVTVYDGERALVGTRISITVLP
jgi:hypothetical protein